MAADDAMSDALHFREMPRAAAMLIRRYDCLRC